MLDRGPTSSIGSPPLIIGPHLALYQANVGEDVTAAYARTILEQYGLTYDWAEERWLEPELHDALAPLRRADIETALVKLRGLFPGVVLVEDVLNSTKNAYHRETVVGRTVITQSMVDGPKGPIRYARHRDTLAQRSQLCLDLFQVGTPASREGELALWACWVHMPSDMLDRPSFVRLAFPFEDGTWEESYDLYDLVPSLRGYTESEAVLALRRDAKQARGAA
jgi:hypothetical protein